jgi:pyridinium-3,5-biscarboxylic acid mononucleotide sulfurtransferase
MATTAAGSRILARRLHHGPHLSLSLRLCNLVVQSSSRKGGELPVAPGSSCCGKRRYLVHISRTTATVNDDDTTSPHHPTISAGGADNQYAAVDPTKLVDDLLEYTESLMTKTKDTERHFTTNSSSSQRRRRHHHIIAFSGGIDSSVVTALIHHVQQQQQQQQNTLTQDHHTVTAVLGVSPALSREQQVLAEQVAAHLQVNFETIATTEGDDELYRLNDGRACLACKTHLYTCLNSIAEHYQKRNHATTNNIHHHHHHQLYNGTNADDLLDPTRLGLIAAQNYHVLSPLQHTPKALVRIAGKHLGLPNWNYAASPCLRSRLALGVQALPDHLRRIERAEGFVREQLQNKSMLQASHNLRVRLLSNNRAMIEVDEELLQSVQDQIHNESSTSWRTMFVKTLGFQSVDARLFKTGSVAATGAIHSTRRNTSSRL